MKISLSSDRRLRVDMSRLKKMVSNREIVVFWLYGNLQVADSSIKRSASILKLFEVLDTYQFWKKKEVLKDRNYNVDYELSPLNHSRYIKICYLAETALQSQGEMSSVAIIQETWRRSNTRTFFNLKKTHTHTFLYLCIYMVLVFDLFSNFSCHQPLNC